MGDAIIGMMYLHPYCCANLFTEGKGRSIETITGVGKVQRWNSEEEMSI